MKRAALALLLAIGAAQAETIPAPGAVDSRIRTVAYNPEDVIELRGYVGYSLHLQWAEGEKFIGLTSGYNAAVAFDDEGNHLFIKPIRPSFSTNLTVLTDRRTYNFEYTAAEAPAKGRPKEMIYSLRFTYPQDEAKAAAARVEAARTEARLAAPSALPRNSDYWFCGAPSLRPESAWDDGAQTHLQFPAGAEFPALFAQGEDGSESLVNFNVNGADVVIHRTAGRFVLRRGALVGCVINKAFGSNSARLPGHAIAAGVERAIKEAP